MGKIIISENAALDGVVEDPTGDDGTSFGGWFSGLSDADRQAWAEMGLQEALTARAMILGRRSDAWFAERWISRSGAWADRLNSMPKYVFSSSSDSAMWSNATVLNGDLVSEVTKLKRDIQGDLVVIGSTRLAHALWAHDLVDELRVKIFPVAAGAGRRLFAEDGRRKTMKLLSVSKVGDSMACLTFGRTQET